ncbi:TLDc domain-containing protein [Entamoeba marina]
MEKVIDNNASINFKNDIELEQFNVLLKSLNKWSDKLSYTIIFDSDLNGNGKGVLEHHVKNKINLYFIVFDNENNVFGGYMNTLINKINSYIPDPDAFIFSLIRNGKIKNMKYDIKEGEKCSAFYLDSNNNYLFRFGENGIERHIIIPRIGFNCGVSFRNIGKYKYNEEKHPLRDGTNDFPIQRILVLEMN